MMRDFTALAVPFAAAFLAGYAPASWAQQPDASDADPPLDSVAQTQMAAVVAAVVGYDDGFYVRSLDGGSELRLGFVSQIRSVHNRRSAGGMTDEDERRGISGYQFRRLQVHFRGHFLGPRWTYRLRLDASNAGGISAAFAWVGYQLSDALDIRAGQTKPSFLHEEDVAAPSQLAVERSYTADYFTTKFAQGVQLNWRQDRVRASGMLHNGSYGFRTDVQDASATIATSARVEYLLVGREADAAWRRYADFSSWAGEHATVIVGAAADYERGRNHGGVNRPSIMKWTADVTAKAGPASFFGAVVAQQFDRGGDGGDLPAELDQARQWGAVTHAGVFVLPNRLELFGRYEAIAFDGVYFRVNQGRIDGGSGVLDRSELRMLTFGGTYYFSRHNAKLTLDTVVSTDPVPVANTGQGLFTSHAGTQFALRTQLQFGF
jgi:hypothetical protein